MTTKIFLNKKNVYQDLVISFSICYFIPIYLLFNWDKVVIERFLFVIAATTFIFILIIRKRYKFYKDIHRVQDLIFCDGTIIESHASGIKYKYYFAEIEVELNGSKFRFVTKDSRAAGYKKGALTPVLLDLKNPQRSVALEQHPYLKYSKS